ncbi:MAG: hypothetical protein AB8F95_12635 [Bacteroidia bacterium]
MSTLVLSPAELSLFHDQTVMPLKFSILSKMEKLLEQLRHVVAESVAPIASVFPPEFDMTTGKITKGENYNTYPYRVMDLPRAFHGSDIFTFRCVVLWGHPIGFHLILGGRYKALLEEKVIQAAGTYPDGILLSTHDDPWRWEFDPNAYLKAQILADEGVAQACRNHTLLKVSFFMPLEQYLDIPVTGGEIWRLWQLVLFGK